MDRAYVAAVVSEFLAEGKPSDTWPDGGGLARWEYVDAYEMAEEGIREGYFDAFYDDAPITLSKIENPNQMPSIQSVKLKPTAKAFFCVLGPR